MNTGQTSTQLLLPLVLNLIHGNHTKGFDTSARSKAVTGENVSFVDELSLNVYG